MPKGEPKGGAGGEKEERPKSRLELIEDMVTALSTKMDAIVAEFEELKKTGFKKSAGLFGGKRERSAVVDTKTDKVYVSKSAAGKDLATEAGTTGDDHFAWYKLQAKFPDRFRDATPEETAKVEEEVAKEIEEANRRLQEEDAKRATAEKAG